MILDAARKGASDVHVEPSAAGDVDVRYRVDGEIVRAFSFSRALRHAVPARIKVMAGLDIAEKRKAQSGKIALRRWTGDDLELRAETFATVSGAEDVVLRLLPRTGARPLEGLGLSEANLAAFRSMIAKPYGLVLVVGPTGSGKTTTLHSALGALNRGDAKILTAEDPVEITQPGLRQVQVNPRGGVTFASALRSFLRADPDVVMIGEMRDAETCAAAVEASMTGHLVLSTLHTNGAAETVARLLGMGMDPYAFGDSLLGVLAQRLVRALCPSCRTRAPAAPPEAEALREAGDATPEPFLFRSSPAGCEACGRTGWKGRIAVHELLAVDDGIRGLVHRSAPSAEIHRVAAARGMRTLRQDGIAKALAGRTTLDEVAAACSR
jgi:type II secretory ATPase GspE/PulE/Tfp pilus assembly ATPase PilB-like protein